MPISKQCKSFINTLLTKVPKSRATCKQALQHQWIVDNENNPSFNASSVQLLANIEDFSHAGMYLSHVSKSIYNFYFAFALFNFNFF